MAVTPTSFRAHYPEFTDPTIYPDSQINYWLDIAVLMLKADRWLTVYDVGLELFTAHNLALEAGAQNTAAVGGVPGLSTGPTSSKSVDKVSVSYDTSSAIEVGAGHWNLTIYGTRFMKMVKLLGAGPVQVGIGCVPPYSGAAWPGVIIPWSTQ